MRHVAEQEHREREQEEEAWQCRSHEESSLTPLAAPEMELQTSKGKGKGPEWVPELEGGQESWRCDSCEKRNAKCVRIKVCGN